MLGPRRVPIHDDARSPVPPYKLVPNSESLLDQTDLVFIDPVSTGYSRPAAGEDKTQFHGFDEDIESVGQFIHLYTTRYNRWQSPRFLIGESYGTLRAAGLSAHLLERYNMTLNGIALVSSILDFATIVFNQNNDLPYVLFLPTYTATAWYHKRLSPDLQANLEKTLAEVEEFAIGEYSNALFKGDALPEADREAVIQEAGSLHRALARISRSQRNPCRQLSLCQAYYYGGIVRLLAASTVGLSAWIPIPVEKRQVMTRAARLFLHPIPLRSITTCTTI